MEQIKSHSLVGSSGAVSELVLGVNVGQARGTKARDASKSRE